MLRHACGYKLANDGTILERCSTISATRTSSTPSDTPSFHPTGSATSGEISVDGLRHLHTAAHLKGVSLKGSIAIVCCRRRHCPQTQFRGKATPLGRGEERKSNFTPPLTP